MQVTLILCSIFYLKGGENNIYDAHGYPSYPKQLVLYVEECGVDWKRAL